MSTEEVPVQGREIEQDDDVEEEKREEFRESVEEGKSEDVIDAYENEEKREEFRESVVEGNWDNVIDAYENHKESHTILINKRRGTALHVAVNDGEEGVVKRLVDAIVKLLNVKALESKNDRGDTPLHLAATRGFTSSCESIIGQHNERVYLINVDNEQGETPLFLAALSWQIPAFAYLCFLVYHQGANIHRDLIRENGDSILHCAIRAEFFDLALIIIYYFPELCNIQNTEGFSPLKLLATRPSAFKSGCKLRWWKKILYHCLTIETLDVEWEIRYLKKMHELIHHGMLEAPHHSYISMLRDFVATLIHGGSGRNEQSSEKYEHKISIPRQLSDSRQHVKPNYSTWHQFVKFAYRSTLGLPGVGVREVREMKHKHIWSVQLLGKLLENPHESYKGSGGQPYWADEDESGPFLFSNTMQLADKDDQGEENEKKIPSLKINKMETPILTAARNGIVEMVEEILSKVPGALHETTVDKRNILLVAVSSRQPFVVGILKKTLLPVEWDNLTREADNNDNTMLHLAAETLLSKEKTWPVPGSAMQMMWDIKWFQYIKQLAPNHYVSKTNKNEKTAGEIFKESHQDLETKGSEWLKDTSESCSVVAALIASVSFATSATVPGGNNGDTGKPALESHPAFDSFAMASLLGLCFSVTALIMFLSILTSRKQAKDFHRDLPLKLLLGLSSLFISIVAMFVSFCSGHFLVLKDKYKHNILLLYVATFFPVSFYTVAQFPLYVDLLKTILNKVPKAVDKGNDM